MENKSYQYETAQDTRNEIARLRSLYIPILAKIESTTDLRNYLTSTNDVYTRFVLDLISKQDASKVYEEGHHIFPKSVGGLDDDWNILPVSYEDHLRCHELRYKAYGELTDKLAINLRKCQTREQQTIARQKGRETQRIKKIGLFDSTMQSVRGKKGGARQTEAKRERYKEKLSEPVKNALEGAMIWKYASKDGIETELFFAPGSYELVKDLYFALDKAVPYSFSSAKITSHTSGLAKIIKGERLSYQGWKVQLCTLEESVTYLQEMGQKF